MRFLLLTFLIVSLTACAVHGAVSSESSEESQEKLMVCSNKHEVKNCDFKEIHCGQSPKCRQKCICEPGFARTYQGHCVPVDECTGTPHNRVKRGVTDCADPNEVYLYCGSACPARCGDTPGSRTCTTECVKGCFCKKGFVLNSKNKCVKPDKC